MTRPIKLSMGEIADIYFAYESYAIEDRDKVKMNWVLKQFPSSNRICHCVEQGSHLVIYQVTDAAHGRFY